MNKDQQEKRLPRRAMLWIFLTVFVLSIFYNIYSSPANSGKVMRVKAEPYQWPAGCENKRYRYSDEISSKCMDDRYFLNTEFLEAHGIRSRTRRQKWDSYRVGNDVIGFYKSRNENYLSVHRIKRNVFYHGE